MQMIDPHLHIESRTYEDLEMMSMTGIIAVVTQIYYPHEFLTYSSSTILDLFDRLIRFETDRTKQVGIDTFVGVGINMVSVPEDWEEVVKKLPQYLKEEKVVCIGEIGLEPNSVTAELATQEEILKAQLAIAKEHNVPVVFHTPLNKKEKWVERYGYIIDDSKIDKDNVLIDHASSSIVAAIWDIGCHAGITVQPWREIEPLEAARVVAEGEKLDRLMVDSDASAKASDALSVPRSVLEMRKLGVKDADIKKVVFDNPARFYNLPY